MENWSKLAVEVMQEKSSYHLESCVIVGAQQANHGTSSNYLFALFGMLSREVEPSSMM